MYNISGIGEVRERIFFVAETFFFDEDIASFRGFRDSYTMNDELIYRWNSVVMRRDIVYHLGNFSSGDKSETDEVLKQLNGRINLIVGESDNTGNILSLRNKLNSCNYKLEITIDDYRLTMNHYPQYNWNECGNQNSFMLHASTAHNLQHQPPLLQDKLIFDVGLDNPFLKYTPIEFAEICELMKMKYEYFKTEEYFL